MEHIGKFERDCLKAHGYIHSDTESDSGKSEFDEEYFKMKPPPVRNSNSRRIIKISNNEQVKTTNNLITARSNKINNSTNKVYALTVNNLSSGEVNQNESFTKPSYNNRASQLNKVLDSTIVVVNQSFKRKDAADENEFHNSNGYPIMAPISWQNFVHRGAEPKQYHNSNRSQNSIPTNKLQKLSKVDAMQYNNIHGGINHFDAVDKKPADVNEYRNSNQVSTNNRQGQFDVCEIQQIRQNSHQGTEPKQLVVIDVDQYHNSNTSQKIVPTNQWQRPRDVEDGRMRQNDACGGIESRLFSVDEIRQRRQIHYRDTHRRQLQVADAGAPYNDKMDPDICSNKGETLDKQSNASKRQNDVHLGEYINPAYNEIVTPNIHNNIEQRRIVNENVHRNSNEQDITSDEFLAYDNKLCRCCCSIL